MKLSCITLAVFCLALASGHRWYNWQFDLTCESTKLIVPLDEEDLALFVRSQYRNGSLLKVVGNGHAFGNMSTCVDVSLTRRDSYVIQLTNLVDFSVNGLEVTFGAGWDLIDLVPALREHGLTLSNIGTERVQNFVGAFTTGTHGTGKHLGNIASQIIGLRIMDSKGIVHVVNATSNPLWLPAVSVSLGALGIITEVTLLAETINNLKRTTVIFAADKNLTKMYADMYELYQQHERMMIWGPHMTWNTTNLNWDIDPQMSVTYWEPTNITDVHNCSSNYCANGCGNCVVNSVCYDYSIDAISTPPAGVCNRFFYAEIEHFIPVEHFLEAAPAYTKYQLEQTSRMVGYNNMDMIYELRFVKGDQNFMSPVNTYAVQNLSGIFAVFEIDWYMTYNNFNTLWFYQTLAQEYIPRFGNLYGPRPHWGKMSWFNITYTSKIYPRVVDFLELQRYLDPQCQFANAFLIEHLGMTWCPSIYEAVTPQDITDSAHSFSSLSIWFSLVVLFLGLL